MGLVTLHAAPVVLPVCADPVPDGAVAVSGDRILAVGPEAELEATYAGARLRRWPGLLLPGLVNAHTHLQYSDFADLADAGLPFPEWIVTLTQRRHGYTAARWAESTRRGLHALLSTGTTACADIVTDAGPLPPTARSGIGGVSYLEVVGVDDRRWRTTARATLLDRLASAAAGRALGVSPHTLYTLGQEAFADCVAVARSRGLRWHTHVAETADEVAYVAGGTGPLAATVARWGLAMDLLDGGCGRTPVGQLAHLGVLGPDGHVAHGVHVTAADRRLLADAGTAVALCVRSNAVLGAGEPPVAAYLADGVPLAVGTDSLASSPSLDLVAEGVALRALARRQGAPAAGLDRAVVTALTAGGAAALGLTDVGVLAAGARADLAVFDVPVTGDPWAALLDHGTGRCLATVLRGRLVHRSTPSTRLAAGAEPPPGRVVP